MEIVRCFSGKEAQAEITLLGPVFGTPEERDRHRRKQDQRGGPTAPVFRPGSRRIWPFREVRQVRCLRNVGSRVHESVLPSPARLQPQRRGKTVRVSKRKTSHGWISQAGSEL